MSNKNKLTIKTSKRSAVTITRSALKAERLVYILVANKKFDYDLGKSRIAYIGTTKAGASRIAESIVKRATQVLDLHGVSELRSFIITCASRQHVKTWKKLETGLILTFRERYGQPPKCNTQGKKQKWKDELEYFTRSRLEGVLDKYS